MAENPFAIRKLLGSVFYRTGVIADYDNREFGVSLAKNGKY